MISACRPCCCPREPGRRRQPLLQPDRGHQGRRRAAGHARVRPDRRTRGARPAQRRRRGRLPPGRPGRRPARRRGRPRPARRRQRRDDLSGGADDDQLSGSRRTPTRWPARPAPTPCTAATATTASPRSATATASGETIDVGSNVISGGSRDRHDRRGQRAPRPDRLRARARISATIDRIDRLKDCEKRTLPGLAAAAGRPRQGRARAAPSWSASDRSSTTDRRTEFFSISVKGPGKCQQHRQQRDRRHLPPRRRGALPAAAVHRQRQRRQALVPAATTAAGQLRLDRQGEVQARARPQARPRVHRLQAQSASSPSAFDSLPVVVGQPQNQACHRCGRGRCG